MKNFFYSGERVEMEEDMDSMVTYLTEMMEREGKKRE
jgi:hypothetical protein